MAAKLLHELRDFGVKIYLDDFGTGYSSLSHLHKLPVDALKIDRSFVKSLLLPDRPAIVESILALARTMKTSVVAEGIEDEVQARELERLGCTHAQGFLFSRPLSAGAVEEILMANQPLGPTRVQPSPRVAATADELSYSSKPPSGRRNCSRPADSSPPRVRVSGFSRTVLVRLPVLRSSGGKADDFGRRRIPPVSLLGFLRPALVGGNEGCTRGRRKSSERRRPCDG